MFVTRGAQTTGVHVGEELSDAELGAAILEFYGRPGIAEADRGEAWRMFCTEVAGAPAGRYWPEKTARVFRETGDSGTWCVVAGHFSDRVPVPAEPAVDFPQRLGAVVRRELAALAPNWPRVRSAVIMTTATGRWVVVPHDRGTVSGPAHAVDAGAGPLLTAVRAALADSGGATMSWADSLAAAGIDPHLLRGGAQVMFDELADGSVRLVGEGSAANRPVGERTWTGRADDLAAACAEAGRMLAELPVEHLPPGTPSGTSFGIKCTWLAVRGTSVEEVAAAVGLTGARPAGWDEGVAAADDEQVFVTPPIAGWILVVNTVHVHGAESVAQLSARLGAEVQYFGNHRVSDYAEWARAVDGRLVRHVLCGEGLEPGVHAEEVGVPTPVEIEIGFSATDPGAVWADEDDVMRVAGAWSIDPITLDVVESSPRDGLLGRFGAAG
ncbi:hypothetical protein [Actinoplanes philippinensis]|nr:hypothetical protein [Actinoplanes philippinensis]